MDLGLDIRGRYVLGEEVNDRKTNERLDPIQKRRLLGRVREVIGDKLLLDDAPGANQIHVDHAWLEPRREHVEDCLRVAGIRDVDGILHRLEIEIFQLTGAEGRLVRTDDVATIFQREGSIPIAADLSFTAEDILTPQQGINAGTYRQFAPPRFIFDPAGSKSDRWHDRGLQQFGPFDAESFTNKQIHAVVVTPKEFKGDIEVFLRKFKEGLPQSKNFTQGFVRKYHLNECTFHFQSFEPGQQEGASYRKACLQALQGTPKPNLAFVVIQDRHKQLQGDQNPYLVSKSTFMSQGVPVQEIEIETIRVSPKQEAGIQYKLNNIGLASYAKLGGIPFVIASASGLAHELVIGIGSAILSSGRLTGKQRVVGITTVFSADGNYLLYNTSREVDFEDYPDELLSTLQIAVEQIKVRNAWQRGDTVRLVFHVFKPLRDIEAQAVKKLIEQLVEFEVEFAFLHISDDHDWILFDRSSAGAPDWQVADYRLRGKIKGEYVPERGYAIPLGRREMLLSVTGPRQLKTPLQGAPRPLLLNLHRESTFESLEYLANQVFRFTALSWRSFFPSSRPVTILYSDRIAELLGQLRQVTNWNPDILTTTLRGSRWFL